ncbi:MAG: mechanosensitive ion channel family protein [Candidatus Limnocylindrales bacterium]
MPDFDQAPWPAIVSFVTATVIPILITLVAAWIVLVVADRFFTRLTRRLMVREAREGSARELPAAEVERRIETVASLASFIVRVIVFAIAGLAILAKLNVDIGPAIAGLGIVGIAVGFGAQSLVRDFFNGVLILVENQFAKGDVVTIADVTGTVEDFTLRRTTLRDTDGVVHSVPNGAISVASNLTRLWARINEDVVLAYGTDVDRAAAVVDEVGRAMAAEDAWKDRVLEPAHAERVKALGETGITLKIYGTVLAEARWDAAGALRKRLLAAFEANGIELARPSRVVLAAGVAAVPGSAVGSGPAPGPGDAAPTAGTGSVG